MGRGVNIEVQSYRKTGTEIIKYQPTQILYMYIKAQIDENFIIIYFRSFSYNEKQRKSFLLDVYFFVLFVYRWKTNTKTKQDREQCNNDLRKFD